VTGPARARATGLGGLLAARERLRCEAEGLLHELDHLRCHVVPKAEAKYMGVIGALEGELFEAEARSLEFRRMVEIVEAALMGAGGRRLSRAEMEDLVARFDSEVW
jgi:hypothetical protein